MKTRGVQVESGYLLVSPGRAVPDALWSRLKHRAQLVGQLEEFTDDYRASRLQALATMPGFPSQKLQHFSDAEQVLFQRWVNRLAVELPVNDDAEPLWPWSRGWTEDLVDSYLSSGTESPAVEGRMPTADSRTPQGARGGSEAPTSSNRRVA